MTPDERLRALAIRGACGMPANPFDAIRQTDMRTPVPLYRERIADRRAAERAFWQHLGYAEQLVAMYQGYQP